MVVLEKGHGVEQKHLQSHEYSHEMSWELVFNIVPETLAHGAEVSEVKRVQSLMNMNEQFNSWSTLSFIAVCLFHNDHKDMWKLEADADAG